VANAYDTRHLQRDRLLPGTKRFDVLQQFRLMRRQVVKQREM
jgi:hypothetical protein